MYDIKKNIFEKGIKDTDYLTETIPYNYDKSNDEDKQKVRDILYKICNCNEEHLEYYSSILGFSMIGDPEKEKSIGIFFNRKQGEQWQVDYYECNCEYYAKLL